MIFFIESVILCLVFTLMVIPSCRKDPLAWASDYPPAVRQRLKDLGKLPREAPRMDRKTLIRKLAATAFCVVLLALVVSYINHADSFLSAFLTGYGLWLVVTWYDAFVLDILWVCHDPAFRIPGTEDMEEAYHDYWFHIRMSGVGTLLGLPASLLAALVADLFFI